MKLKRKFDMVTPFEKVLACIITVETVNFDGISHGRYRRPKVKKTK